MHIQSLMSAAPAPDTYRPEQPQPRHASACPVEDWLAFLGHRWSAVILWHLKHGPRRHHELTAALPGISPKVLAERLDGLEHRGLVTRHEIASYPKAVVYALSDSGRSLIHILDQVDIWAQCHGVPESR
jgi:DNA-binding HxlR family transcriptional regulator